LLKIINTELTVAIFLPDANCALVENLSCGKKYRSLKTEEILRINL